MLYDKNTYVQDIVLEKQILSGSHILSKYFTVVPIIVLNESGKIASRCLLTFYENDSNAYIGFFESINSTEASRCLFKASEMLASKNGKTKLVGPLNASFWIGYSLKTNKFDSVYTSEPYNKAYYLDLWKDAGFKIKEKYFSNIMRAPTENDQSAKCIKRLQMIKNSGYIIKSPKKSTFNKNLREIYGLLIRTYSGFPMFKKINEEDFFNMFRGLKYILDFNLVKLVYKESKLVGFFICVPDYKNLTHQKITIINLMKILKIKNEKNKKYIALYMGIDSKHPGLGSAMSEIIKKELEKRQSCSVGALIHDGKISGEYYKQLIIDKYEYVLFEKSILLGAVPAPSIRGAVPALSIRGAVPALSIRVFARSARSY